VGGRLVSAARDSDSSVIDPTLDETVRSWVPSPNVPLADALDPLRSASSGRSDTERSPASALN
jgi:hypothetical protein